MPAGKYCCLKWPSATHYRARLQSPRPLVFKRGLSPEPLSHWFGPRDSIAPWLKTKLRPRLCFIESTFFGRRDHCPQASIAKYPAGAASEWSGAGATRTGNPTRPWRRPYR